VTYHSVRAELALGFQGNPADGVYLGVELETNSALGHRELDAIAVQNLMPGFVIPMSDASIGYGTEFVSAPASYDVHLAMWNRLFSAVPSGMTAWDTTDGEHPQGRCGLHIHVSKAPLSRETQGKIVVFIHSRANRRFIITIAGRRPNGYWRFADGKTVDSIYNHDRYEAVNFQKHGTVEFRMFRATLNKARFFADLEFCAALVSYCRAADVAAMDHGTFVSWVHSEAQAYPHLAAFLTSRGYGPSVNSAVTAGPAPVPVTETRSASGRRSWFIFGIPVCDVMRAMVAAGMTLDQLCTSMRRVVPTMDCSPYSLRPMMTSTGRRAPLTAQQLEALR
jgi:hypothetical protein